MRLEGIDHITGITGDGQRCLDFYAGILGLPFHGRHRDFESPDSHLIRLGRSQGPSGGVLDFIEAPGIGRGRAGDGMAHLLRWTVRSPAALDFWAKRLSRAGIEVQLSAGDEGARLRFADPEGLAHELEVEGADGTAGLGSAAIPDRHAIVRLAGVRAYGRAGVPSADILAGRLGFRVTGPDSYVIGQGRRSAGFALDTPPHERGRVGAGTIHHIALATDGSLAAWRQRVIGLGCRATPVIDRGRCRSIYFREPSGVLLEIAAASHPSSEDPGEPEFRGRRLSPAVDPRLRVGALG